MINYTINRLFNTCLPLLLLLGSYGLPYSVCAEQQAVVQLSNNQLSETELLSRAKSKKDSQIKLSIQLSNQALTLSLANNNDLVTAQTHAFLAQHSEQAKQKKATRLHLLQAAVFYEKAGEYQQAFASSQDYIQRSLKAKSYSELQKEVERILPSALTHATPSQVGWLYMMKAESHYKQKKFELAVNNYLNAVDYFTDQDKTVQRHLGDTYKMLAQSYKRLKDKQKTVAFYEKALVVYSALENKKLIARTLNTLAEAQRKLGHLIIALDYSKRSLEVHAQIDDQEGRAKALNGAGIIYRHIGLYEKSLEHVHQAHLLFKGLGSTKNIGKTSNQMGLLYTRLKQFEQAKFFYQQTIDLPANKLDAKTIASAKREMAVILINSKEYEKAKQMALKAYKIYQDSNDKNKASLTSRIIGNAYRDQEDVQQAIIYYRQSLQLAKEVGSKIYQIKAQTPLASMLIGLDNEEAMSLLLDALVIAKQIKSTSQTLYAVRELRKVEKSLGNFKQSLAYAEQEMKLTELIQKEKEEQEIAVVKAKLHSHKIEMELASLQEKSKLHQLALDKKNNLIEMAEQANKIAELELTKKRYTNAALSTAILLCLLVVLYINRRFINSRKKNKELGYLAERDPLTNCYNRRILLEMLNRALSNAELHDDYCIMMVDIDHFKVVNDTHGHSVGDKVLCGVADTLRAVMRSSDITTRYGGEEFCIVLADISLEQVVLLAESLREKIQASVFEGIQVTCSFGITSIKFGALTPSELIDQADAALYQSKSNGRNRVTLWHGETVLKGV